MSSTIPANSIPAASAMLALPGSTASQTERSTASSLPDDGPAAEVSVSGSARLFAQLEAAESPQAGEAEGDAPVQSFVYGALGLERPEEQAKAENAYYSAGKWLAAAATVGTMVSLLV